MRRMKKAVSGLTLTLFMLGMMMLVLNVHSQAGETVYIRADGSIDPPTAPIQRNGGIYTLTGNISIAEPFSDGIVVERDNMTLDGAGYSLLGADYKDWRGIRLTGRNNVTVRNMEIHEFGYGIALYYSNYCSIYGNNITRGGEEGIRLFYANFNNLSENNIANPYYGIDLSYSNFTNVARSKITSVKEGITSISSSNNTISASNITASEYGIRMMSSSYNKLVGNNITDSGQAGIYFESSANNTISGNDIINNLYGVRLKNSPANQFFHNNFVSNSRHAIIYNSGTNSWDAGYPSGGNYWSDYIGTDLFNGPYQNVTGPDGIGDTPYNIPYPDNADHYPLMTPYRNLPESPHQPEPSQIELILGYFSIAIIGAGIALVIIGIIFRKRKE